jgi:hypothetical protein
VAEEICETREVVLNKILDVWLDKMALVTEFDRRKLLALALASLLTAQSRYNSPRTADTRASSQCAYEQHIKYTVLHYIVNFCTFPTSELHKNWR